MKISAWQLLIFFVFAMVQNSKAQLCTGSLGDPIVNRTFGSGSNPGPSLSAAATTYQYTGNFCPGDGFYTVRSSVTGCNAWHALAADHTGDGNGYFMLVNASNQPSAFYIDTVNLLCSNTVYEFAAWVANMNKPSECSGNPNQPNLTFTIEKTDGTVLQTYNSGNIPPSSSPTWNQYGFFFSTPPGVSALVLRIFNNAPGGCGNDLALDDITFRPCGPIVQGAIDGNGTARNLCAGQSAQFQFNATLSNGYTNPVLQWQISSNNGVTWTDIVGATSNNLPVTVPGTAPVGTVLYRLAVSRPENAGVTACRVHSNNLSVTVNPVPVSNLPSSKTLCEHETLQLSTSGGSQYQWTGPSGFTWGADAISVDDLQTGQSGLYIVTVTNSVGCKVLDTTDVIVHVAPVAAATAQPPSICEGNGSQLTATGAGAYLWSPANGLSGTSIANPVASPTDTTEYRVIVSNANGCADTAFVTLNVWKKPLANAGPDKFIVIGQSVVLEGSASGSSINHTWSPSIFITGSSSLNPTVSPTADTTYILSVSSGVGCGDAVDSVRVRVVRGLFVPTAFTPNGDGKNDSWNIPGLAAYSDFNVKVFNRYGQVVFVTKVAKGWDGTFDGKPQPSGVYPYLIELKKEHQVLKGWIVLIR